MKYPSATTIKADLNIENGGSTHKYFTERCHVYMGPFIPGGVSGEINESAELSTDEIAYNSPFAHYLHTGILYVDPETGSSWARKGQTKISTGKALEYHTPGTGAHWDEKMWNSKGEKIISEVQKKMDKE